MIIIGKEKILWYLFYSVFSVSLLSAIGALFHLGFAGTFLFKIILPSTLPILLLILHSFWTLSILRGLFLISLAGLTGLFFEIVGLKYGTFFGGQYIYNATMPQIFGVPFMVVLYWALFIYTGYAITNSFVYWLNKDKPSKFNRQLIMLVLLILSDGIIVTLIDLFMDPIQVRAGAWTWLQGGPYFGIPLGNFTGWFAVTVIVTTIFRLIEYFKPKKITVNKSVFLIPVIGYLVLASFYSLLALQLKLYGLIAFCLIPMLFISGYNIRLYKKWSATHI